MQICSFGRGGGRLIRTRRRLHLPGIITEYESFRVGGADVIARAQVNGRSWPGLRWPPFWLGERSKCYLMWGTNGTAKHLEAEQDLTVAGVSATYTRLGMLYCWSVGSAQG